MQLLKFNIFFVFLRALILKNNIKKNRKIVVHFLRYRLLEGKARVGLSYEEGCCLVRRIKGWELLKLDKKKQTKILVCFVNLCFIIRI